NFATAFPAPNYLTIGCGNRTLKLTSASAVTAFLPSSGYVSRLPNGAMQNPGTSYGNTFAGQLVALKLAVRFDELSASFSPATVLLKNMTIASGTFAGWTVQQLITEADSKIGSCGGNYSRTTLNIAITAINEGYAGGTLNSGYLSCPGGSGMVIDGGEPKVIEAPLGDVLEVTVFPNPVHGMATFVITGTTEDQPTTVELFSVSGVRVGQLFSGTLARGSEHRVQWDAGSQAKGMYFYRVVSGEHRATGKILVE
ncbi:MAG TPA: T9SS type A sorting domain-containing protein, partial [Flavobacteriales bacterium]|nr:T9SS type A sorting domain-containing protein [Flavobacteriales bacterium]